MLTYLFDCAERKGDNFYMGFMDLRKAYDSVSRTGLWNRLKTLVVAPEFIQLIQSLYVNTTRQVLWKGHLTESFMSAHGLRQGCPMSPLLFALFIPQVPVKVAPVGIPLYDSKILSMYYADDLVLVASTQEDLQQSLKVAVDEFESMEFNYDICAIVQNIRSQGQVLQNWIIKSTHGGEGVIEEVTKEQEHAVPWSVVLFIGNYI